MSSTPEQILERVRRRAESLEGESAISAGAIRERIERVCRCARNRAPTRLLMACMLAKVHRPTVDPRKPYTEIGSRDSFSGRTYDEQYLTRFIADHGLPCNPTTAFLTPALRNRNETLTPDTDLVGRPRQVYRDALQLLDDVASDRVSAEDVLTESVRILLRVRDERRERLQVLRQELGHGADALPLSTEAIVGLLRQHLACRYSSRLPVLMVAAAYECAADHLGEMVRPLRDHLAADQRTGAIGDVEVCLIDNGRLVTVYEMKARQVTREDIDRALDKIGQAAAHVDHYIFITTEPICDDVRDYARHMYEQAGGIEIAILDCIGFVRHFLHLFHRLRISFLDAYQRLLLEAPDSAVPHALKEAFLALRLTAETEG